MKEIRPFAITFIFIFLLTFISGHSYGISNVAEDKNVYIVVINKLTLLDIEKMPNLKKLIDEGSFGLMNVRGTSGYRGAESYATINASNKAYANYESSQFYNLNTELKKMYESRVEVLDREYAIGNIEIGKLYNQNENNRYSPQLGILGDNLHNVGLRTAAFGNSDTDEEIIRTASLIPMDSKGLVDYGNVDNILIEDSDYPYGFRTDYKRILREVLEVKEKASLIVIDTGDLNRLNNYNNLLSNNIFDKKRDLILENIDGFIGNLVETIDKDKSLLMVLSPNSGEERTVDSKLSPIALWGNDIDNNMIISSTTKRPGIIANFDIAPTVANFLNISLENMSGNVIEYMEKDNIFNYIKSIDGRINLTSQVRSRTLTTYGIISIVIILIVVFVFLIKIRIDNKIGKLLKNLLLILYSLPMIFILSSLLKIDSLFKFFISLFFFISIFIFIVKRYNNHKMLYYLTFSYYLIVIIDILFDGIITKFSIMSHDPIIGARYFGIGNEMVGLFLAVSTLSAGLLYEKYNKKFIPILILLLSLFMVGNPKLGANVGGTIAFLFAIIFLALQIIDKELNFKNIIGTIIIVSIVIGVLGYVDVQFNSNPTHLGRSIIAIGDQGLNIIQNIISRKLLVNIRLVGTSFWTKVLFVNIIVQGIVSYLHKDRIKKIMNSNLGKSYLACITSSIIGFIVNDSGLILSAISINFITIFLLFIIVNDEEIYNKQEVD